MNYLQGSPNLFRQKGMSPFGIIIFIIILIILLFICDQAYILSQRCADEDIIECALDILTGEEDEVAAGAVTATGIISGTYGGSERSVTVTFNFPPSGGDVTGNFSGDCDGSIKGSYAGSGGTINGTANGSCGFVFPASGKFSGTVNETAKTVPISGSGSAAGFSGEGSLTLKY